MRVYYRNLPHWRQPGATYFVTFRQVDSIPKVVLAEWLDLRDRWFRAHHIDPMWVKTDTARLADAFEKIAPEVRRAFEREQAKLLHEELDRCHGSCVLRHQSPQQEIVKSLAHFDGSRLVLGDFVVMPNHVHALVTPLEDFELEDLLGSIKRWTSRVIGEWLETQPATVRPEGPERSREAFWQQESYDRIVRDVEELDRFRKYIAENAAKANVPDGQFYYMAAAWLDEFAPRPESPP